MTMKRIHQMTIAQWEAAFPDEDACKAYLMVHRWPDGVACSHCGNEEVVELGFKPWRGHCARCGKPKYCSAVVAGTVFENTNVPIRHWFRVTHLLLTSKKGMAVLQIQRMLGFGTCRPAWYMYHRVRAALADESFAKLMGIGGRGRNWHKGKRTADSSGTGERVKSFIIGAVGRKGNAVARGRPSFVQQGSL